ncbi:HTH domain-containing protein [Candidatus Woesearchaeota archaeon]|nr:HTH domain-containing protein [Candidatus Woesearchaeota archaeon]
MGQQEVYDFLKKNKKMWFSSKDIAKKLKVSIGSVTNSLKRLRESKQVLFKIKKKEPMARKIFEYKFKK